MNDMLKSAGLPPGVAEALANGTSAIRSPYWVRTTL